MERLFVYGTLAPGRVNHRVIEHIPGTWEKAILKGKLIDAGWGSSLGYPGVIPTTDGEDVNGYLLSSNHLSKHWAMLDEYEGIGYKRISVKVRIKGEAEIEAYVYALNNTPDP